MKKINNMKKKKKKNVIIFFTISQDSVERILILYIQLITKLQQLSNILNK